MAGANAVPARPGRKRGLTNRAPGRRAGMDRFLPFLRHRAALRRSSGMETMSSRKPGAEDAAPLFQRLWSRIGGGPLRHDSDAAAPSTMQHSGFASSRAWADTVIDDDRRVAPTDDANNGLS
jgi:hypothetical protein